jgi:hypothetical protein
MGAPSAAINSTSRTVSGKLVRAGGAAGRAPREAVIFTAGCETPTVELLSSLELQLDTPKAANIVRTQNVAKMRRGDQNLTWVGDLLEDILFTFRSQLLSHKNTELPVHKQA